MTPTEIIQLIEAARAHGVSSLKAGDIEFRFGGDPVSPQPKTVVAPQPEANPDLSPEIKHKVEELKSVMRLDDQELIERMFPLPAQDPEDAA